MTHEEYQLGRLGLRSRFSLVQIISEWTSSIGFDSLDSEYAYYSALQTVVRCIDDVLCQSEVIVEDDITDEFEMPDVED